MEKKEIARKLLEILARKYGGEVEEENGKLTLNMENVKYVLDVDNKVVDTVADNSRVLQKRNNNAVLSGGEMQQRTKGSLRARP